MSEPWVLGGELFAAAVLEDSLLVAPFVPEGAPSGRALVPPAESMSSIAANGSTSAAGVGVAIAVVTTNGIQDPSLTTIDRLVAMLCWQIVSPPVDSGA